jgi:hypothetical protein
MVGTIEDAQAKARTLKWTLSRFRYLLLKLKSIRDQLWACR